MRYLIIIFSACLYIASFNGPAMAQDTFLEGFPDIPHLDDFDIIDDSLMVFDSASGTVAEVSMYTGKSITEGLTAYKDSLGGLGWSCARVKSRISCERDGFLLTVIASQDKEKRARVTLRSEPKS